MKTTKRFHSIHIPSLLLILAVLPFSTIAARPILSPLFSDNMVVQHNSDVPIWGKASPNKRVTISASWDATSTAWADGMGNWETKINTPKAGGPFTITIDDGEAITLHNVMSGEVWLCSGQSNMEMPIDGWTHVMNHEAEKKEANNYPNIRLLSVHDNASHLPIKEFTTDSGKGWLVCDEHSVKEFSATAYFFGMQLHKQLNVAIGLIDASWGGTFIEAWISGNAANCHLDLKDAWQEVRNTPETPSEMQKYLSNEVRPFLVSVLYNAMIHPIVPFTIKGAIWYQGEQNEHKGYQYRELLPLLINDWRKAWGTDFGFYIAQLANYHSPQSMPEESEWAEVREAQAMTARHVSHTGLACTIDIGDADDIHPKNKQEVGRRLALVALAKSYHKNQEYSGPVFRDYQLEGSNIRIMFNHAEGLHLQENRVLSGFAIAGADRQFYWADATVEGESVVVNNPNVKYPVAVRYGWAQNPPSTLYNAVGLPTVPFRPDDWPGISFHNHEVSNGYGVDYFK